MSGGLWRSTDDFRKAKAMQLICYSVHLHRSTNFFHRMTQIGVVSYGNECPSHGVYARVTEVKHWIQYIAKGALDSNCNSEIPYKAGKLSLILSFFDGLT